MIAHKQIFHELTQLLYIVNVDGYDKPRPLNQSGKKIKLKKF